MKYLIQLHVDEKGQPTEKSFGVHGTLPDEWETVPVQDFNEWYLFPLFQQLRWEAVARKESCLSSSVDEMASAFSPEHNKSCVVVSRDGLCGIQFFDGEMTCRAAPHIECRTPTKSGSSICAVSISRSAFWELIGDMEPPPPALDTFSYIAMELLRRQCLNSSKTN